MLDGIGQSNIEQKNNRQLLQTISVVEPKEDNESQHAGYLDENGQYVKTNGLNWVITRLSRPARSDDSIGYFMLV